MSGLKNSAQEFEERGYSEAEYKELYQNWSTALNHILQNKG